MSESTRSKPAVRSSVGPAADSDVGPDIGAGHRVDGPHAANQSHAIPGARPVKSPAAEAQLDAPASLERLHKHDKEEELLLQASQIAEHLRQQYAELDRREHSLNEQLALLDQERRNVRLSSRQLEEEIEEREQRLRSTEAEFNHKLATCEKLIRELEEQDAELKRRSENLLAERDQLRAVLELELDVERESIRLEHEALSAEQAQFQEQVAEHRREREHLLDALQKQLQEDRGRLERELTAKVEAEHADFLEARREWELRCSTELAEIRQERELTELAFQRSQRDLDTRRSEQAQQLAEELAEHERQLGELRAKCEQDCETQRRELAALRAAELSEMQRALAEFKAEQADEHAHYRQERATLENRLRFQQQHLDKSRTELEALQRDFRVEQQQGRVDLEQAATIVRVRAEQLDRRRELWAQRDASTERERQLLGKLQQELREEMARDRERFEREREVWEEQRQAQRTEIRRQQTMLALHAENLEGRREALDQLRAEMEETHHGTLEMRMAVEEAWAQMSQTVGIDVARQRLDAARAAFPEHYRQLQSTIVEQREELEAARSGLSEQMQKLQTDRQAFADWVLKQEEQLRVWEARLREESDAAQGRDQVWREARDGWNREKLQAEGVIRDLLAQLSEMTEAGASGTGSAMNL